MVWTLPGWYVAHEWAEVVRLGIASEYRTNNLGKPDLQLRIFSCPALGDPVQNLWHDGQPDCGDGYVFHINYNYVGGAASWSLADPAFSPKRPMDEPGWTLMADMILEYPIQQSPRSFQYPAHKEAGNQPSGANHLFNDQHVEWVRWNGGKGMRANALWSEAERYYWRRTVAAP